MVVLLPVRLEHRFFSTCYIQKWLNILVLSEKSTLDTQLIGKEKGVDSRS